MGTSMSLSNEQRNRRYFRNHSIPRKYIKKDKNYKFKKVDGVYYIRQKQFNTKSFVKEYGFQKFANTGNQFNASRIRMNSMQKQKQNKYRQTWSHTNYNLFKPLQIDQRKHKDENQKQIQRQLKQNKHKSDKVIDILQNNQEGSQKLHKIQKYLTYKDKIVQNIKSNDDSNNQPSLPHQISYKITKRNYKQKLEQMLNKTKKRSNSLDIMYKIQSCKEKALKEQQNKLIKRSSIASINDEFQLKTLMQQQNTNQQLYLKDKYGNNSIRQKYENALEYSQIPTKFKNQKSSNKYEETTCEYYTVSIANSQKNDQTQYIPPRKLIYF